MNTFFPAPLFSDDAVAYGQWLNGGRTPVSWSRSEEGRLACLLSPAPWSFWIGIGAVVDGFLHPVLIFKNPVPVMDTRLLGGETPQSIDEGLGRRLEQRLRVHNPGLQGVLEQLRTTPVDRLIGP
ncbi:hypothetical protein AB0Y14_12230 [Rothia sp. HC945]|uniref:hypothetical protein n=1 Tax=Rothia sp. HC945 TaxID=3171170 RepID=UPI003F26C365